MLALSLARAVTGRQRSWSSGAATTAASSTSDPGQVADERAVPFVVAPYNDAEERRSSDRRARTSWQR